MEYKKLRINCSVYLRNSIDSPSCYYRVTQYVDKIDSVNFKIRNTMTNKMFRRSIDETNKHKKIIMQIFFYIIICFRASYFLVYDLISKPKYMIISRTVIPKYMPCIVRVLLKKVIGNSIVYWDFDDYIQKGELDKKQAFLLYENSNKIIVTSEFLKSTIPKEHHQKVIVIPTTDGDMQQFDKVKLCEQRKKTLNAEVRLIWVATRVNLPNIIRILSVLDEAAKYIFEKFGKTTVLTSVCNEDIKYKTNYLLVRNIPWTREDAIREMCGAHIGIMPLICTEYALGKGGFKLIQYMATGLPIIASSVGYNKEIIRNNVGILIEDKENMDSWREAIIAIIISDKSWINYSENAYEHWKSFYDYKYNLKVWNELLSESKIEKE